MKDGEVEVDTSTASTDVSLAECCMRASMYTFVCLRACVHTCLHVCVCVCVCVCVSVCLCVCVEYVATNSICLCTVLLDDAHTKVLY